MTKVFHITVYSDPGHAWGKVARKVLDNLNLSDKVSSYSYQRGDKVYLEEGCDLSLLLARIREHGTKVVIKEKHTDRISRIRSYQPYQQGHTQ